MFVFRFYIIKIYKMWKTANKYYTRLLYVSNDITSTTRTSFLLTNNGRELYASCQNIGLWMFVVFVCWKNKIKITHSAAVILMTVIRLSDCGWSCSYILNKDLCRRFHPFFEYSFFKSILKWNFKWKCANCILNLFGYYINVNEKL